MKNTLLKVLTLGVALAASATLAKADQIPANSGVSVTGPSVYNMSAETITFPTLGSYTINGFSTGAFSMFTAGQQITWDLAGATVPLGVASTSTSAPVWNSPGPSLPIFTAMEGGSTLSFDLTNEFYIPSSYNGLASVTIYGSGVFNLTGYDPTTANFQFTVNNNTGNISGSFSGGGYPTPTAAPTPEPSSLALLGTGLLGAAAIARRRFSARFSA